MTMISHPTGALALRRPHYHLSDERLFERFRQHRDGRAFETLFHRHYDRLCRHVRGQFPCSHRAEEIVHDVFIKLWCNGGQVTIQSSFGSYVQAAVRNQSIDYLRRSRRRPVVSCELDQEFDSDYHDPFTQLAGSEMADRIDAAIEQLPPRGREIFLLSRDQGLKYREIADKLGLSIKTVETHMRRSLISLRAALLAD